jgi:ATP-binding protein involved in chromosome partitioning
LNSPTAPVEIGRANAHDVRILWADGHESTYPAADLRLACPCAGCAQKSASRPSGQLRVLPAGIQTVQPVRIELVGQYAIRIHWSDGHSEGIYSFDRLRADCPCCSVRQHASG